MFNPCSFRIFLAGKGLLSKPIRKASVLDENRRATYNISIPSATASESIFTTFEGESKQLIPVSNVRCIIGLCN